MFCFHFYLIVVNDLTNFEYVVITFRGELSHNSEKDQFKATDRAFDQTDVDSKTRVKMRPSVSTRRRVRPSVCSF